MILIPANNRTTSQPSTCYRSLKWTRHTHDYLQFINPTKLRKPKANLNKYNFVQDNYSWDQYKNGHENCGIL